MYSKGDRVTQSQCGAGTIVEANERYTVIDFDEYGLKVFWTRLVMLMRTAIAPPVPSRRSRSTRRSGAGSNRGAEQR